MSVSVVSGTLCGMDIMSLAAATTFYNLTLGMLLGLAIYWFVRKPGWFRFFAGISCLTCVALFVAIVLSLPYFNPLRAARLLCFGWFLHVTLFSVAAAWKARETPLLRVTSLLLAASLLGIAAFAFRVEPFRLEVTRYRIESAKVSQPIRIGVLADFQTDKFETYEKQSLQRLIDEKPDLILMAGDYLQANHEEAWEVLRDEMNAFLKQNNFEAPLGIYGVGGNTDFRRWPEIFDGLDVTVFRDSRSESADGFSITGLWDQDSFNPCISIPRPIGDSTIDNELHIVLGHAPDFSLSPNVDADLLIAGHTHGGQVRLPGIGPLITFSRVPRAWAAGHTKLTEEKHLVVSRGVGMERRDAPRLRFLCRPQLVFIDVVPN